MACPISHPGASRCDIIEDETDGYRKWPPRLEDCMQASILPPQEYELSQVQNALPFPQNSVGLRLNCSVLSTGLDPSLPGLCHTINEVTNIFRSSNPMLPSGSQSLLTDQLAGGPDAISLMPFFMSFDSAPSTFDSLSCFVPSQAILMESVSSHYINPSSMLNDLLMPPDESFLAEQRGW